MYCSLAQKRHLLALVFVTLVSLFAALATTVATSAGEVACANPNDLGGTIFRDGNANGVLEATDIGLDGVKHGPIVVYAYDDSNTVVVTSTVSITGTYNFPALFDTYSDIRLEFGGLPDYLQIGYSGSNNGTATQFFQAGTCSADLIVLNPAQYCQEAASIGITCFVNGAADSDIDSFVTFEYAADGIATKLGGTAPNPVKLAEADETGSVWGVAYQRGTSVSYASAVIARHIGLGPQGTGGIYQIDGNGVVTDYIDLNGVNAANGGIISTGTLLRTGSSDYTLPAGGSDGSSVDLDAWDAVGKRSLGDIDIAEDDRTLWVVNLFERTLVSVDVSAPTAGAVNQYALTDPGCVNGEFRPWALKMHDGLGYVGMVCDASGASATRANLHAYVVTFDPEAPASSFTTVLDFPLDYARANAGDNGKDAEFHGWIDAWSDIPGHNTFSQPDGYAFNHWNGASWSFPQPMLTDLEFSGSGALILGFADRAGFQGGYANVRPLSGDTAAVFSVDAAGDILYACETATGFAIEGSAACPLGVGQTEYFPNEYYGTLHDETHLGSLALLPGSRTVVSANFDPVEAGFQNGIFSQGMHWYDVTDGSLTQSYQMVDGTITGVRTKAIGLGDMELQCELAPLEIGNRVWIDTDGDGVQDANEMGLPDIAVQLWLDPDGVPGSGDETLVDTVTTGPDGEYYFSAEPNSTYYMSIDPTQAALDTLTTTTSDYDGDSAHSASGLSTDIHDNDGVDDPSTGLVIIQTTTGAAGNNDYTLDFGFTGEPTAIVQTHPCVSI